jgi:hypothetical protein
VAAPGWERTCLPPTQEHARLSFLLLCPKETMVCLTGCPEKGVGRGLESGEKGCGTGWAVRQNQKEGQEGHKGHLRFSPSSAVGESRYLAGAIFQLPHRMLSLARPTQRPCMAYWLRREEARA